jgi:hypothetical protein
MNDATSPEPRPWTVRRWWTLVVLVLLAHVGLVVALGAKKLPPARAVLQVPVLRLVAATNEIIRLNDPTLFALPQANDFSAAIRNGPPADPRLTGLTHPSFRWDEPPGWLPLTTGPWADDLVRFMQTNQFAAWSLDFKPPPPAPPPSPPDRPAPSRQSSLHLRGELARRTLLAPNPLVLTNWPAAEVIAPSKVQVYVDAAGRVFSAVLLPPDHGLEANVHDDRADQMALSLARSARFAPADHVTVGQMIFNWQTVPLPGTNAPALLP